MAHPLLTEALQEAYASALTQRSVIDSLEVRFGDPNFDGEALYLCSGQFAETLNLGPDGWRVFQPLPFRFNLPAQDATGARGLSVAIENVDGAVIAFIQRALAKTEPVLIKYRAFFADDPNTPQTPRPLTLTLSGSESTLSGVVLSATVADVVNEAFPNGYYSFTAFPGLRG
jgi:hypothetical protein